MSKAGAKSQVASGTISSADPNLEESTREDAVLSAADRSEGRIQPIVSLASVVGSLILWELVARFAIHDVAILPAPSAVFNVFIGHLVNEYPAESLTLPQHLLVICLRISIGFVAGSIVGISI